MKPLHTTSATVCPNPGPGPRLRPSADTQPAVATDLVARVVALDMAKSPAAAVMTPDTPTNPAATAIINTDLAVRGSPQETGKDSAATGHPLAPGVILAPRITHQARVSCSKTTIFIKTPHSVALMYSNGQNNSSVFEKVNNWKKSSNKLCFNALGTLHAFQSKKSWKT